VVGRALACAAVVATTVWLAAPAERIVTDLTEFQVFAAYPSDARTLPSGLTVNVPRGIEACFGAPLPCTPYPDQRLALIEPGVLASGFWIDERIPAAAATTGPAAMSGGR
jgi:hypothetical protein